MAATDSGRAILSSREGHAVDRKRADVADVREAIHHERAVLTLSSTTQGLAINLPPVLAPALQQGHLKARSPLVCGDCGRCLRAMPDAKNARLRATPGGQRQTVSIRAVKLALRQR